MNVEGLRTNSLDAFFSFLYDGLEGYVAIAELTRRPMGKDWLQHHFYLYPQQKKDMIAHVNLRASMIDIYMTPSVFSQPLAQKEYFRASNVSWVEFDAQPNSYGENRPSLRIQSSIAGKEHWYFRMSSPFTDIKALEASNKALAYSLGGDHGGWDAVQLLRPITGTNHKYPGKPLVTVLGAWDLVYPPGHLEEGYVESNPIPIQEQPLILPDVEEVFLKYPWPDKAIELVRMTTCPPGERSSSLMAVGYYCAELGVSNAEILVVLLWADDKWGKFKDRPDRFKRLSEIIVIARRKYPEGASSNGYVEEFIVKGWIGIRDLDVNFDWVIDQMLLENTTLVLAGKPDVGKTQLSLRFGINLALGNARFLDYKITKQRKMLFLGLELGQVPTKHLTNTMSKGLTQEQQEILDAQLLIAPIGMAVPLNENAGRDIVKRVLDKTQPDGIIVDSIGKAVSGGLSKEENVQSSMGFLNELNNQGCFVWGIHHLRKDEKNARAREPELDDLFGNQYIGAYARSVYALHNGDNGLELLTLKQNFAAKPGYSTIIHRTEALDFVKGGIVTDEEKAENQDKAKKQFGEA